MEGYVIASVDEETGNLKEYWDGIVLAESPVGAKFFTDKIEARKFLGSLQTQTPGTEFRLAKAQLIVTVLK